MTAAMGPSIAGLWVYPVKSCKGISLSSSRLAERGLEHDREWMIVRSGGDPARFVTQREYPRLAQICTALSDSALTLSAQGSEDLHIEFSRGGERHAVVVWRDTVSAFDQGDDAARWLSSFIGEALRLVRFDASFERFCNRDFAGDSGAHTGFADGYPLLVVSSASLNDLNARLEERGQAALPMNRFRPNLVIDGLDAYDEDHLSSLRIGGIGDVELQMVKPCVRCQITTTDQQTAVVGDEPLPTLASYRIDADLGNVTFGMNAIITNGVGATIDTGAPIAIDWNF